MPKEVVNELKPEFLTINSLNPWPWANSSPRAVMFGSSHLGQALVVSGATPRRCFTGTEQEFGKFTFNIKMPCDALIIKVIKKYPQTVGMDSIEHNPSCLVIYEDMTTKEIGMLELIDNSLSVDNKHQHFGFKYVYRPAVVDQLSAGAKIPKGTVIADSPNIDKQGNYCYGVESNVAFMSVPGIIEDGVIVSESYLKKITAKGFERRVVSYGKKYYPLNLYGDKNHYKPFPDIGERVRSDGLLMALRPYDDLLGPIEMHPESLMEIDFMFDKLVYAVPNAKVVDVDVYHDDTSRLEPTPTGMDAQARKYYNALTRYYTSIIETYESIYAKYRSEKTIPHITPEFHRLVVEATNFVGFDGTNAVKKMARGGELSKRKVQKLYKRSAIDDWRLDIAFEYDVVPNEAFKLTGTNGDKGVICAVFPDEIMPVDKAGNRAELIMDGDSTIKRMNIARLYEHYINAASRDVTKRVVEMMQVGGGNAYTQAWDYLMGYYSTVSPRMAKLLSKYNATDIKKHVDSVVSEGIYLWIPTDNAIDPIEMVKEIRDKYPPVFDKVTYAGGVVTDRPVLIGSMYIMLLEKTGVDWSGVSSAKLQHFGIPAKVSSSDRFASPGKNQPVRILGEAEVRSINASVGSEVIADLLDQSNSPATHKYIVNKLLTTDKPTNIEEIVDRNDIPLGNSRSLLFVKHILECAGVEFVRDIDDPLRKAEIDVRVGSTRKARR